VEYHASAEYDDRLQVGMRCTRMGNSSMGFEAAVFRGDEVLVTAELIYVYADPHAHKSMPIPESLRQVLNAFEAGDAMIEIRTEAWTACQEEVRALRRSVFVDEWHMPEAWITDPLDGQAHHLVARNRLGRMVGACRVQALPEAEGHVSQLLVHRGTRGSRIGSALVQAVSSNVPQWDLKRLTLETRLSTIPFFESLGYQCEGAPVESQGVVHQRLTLNG
jgi:predicted GNAT family N-acyltransferase